MPRTGVFEFDCIGKFCFADQTVEFARRGLRLSMLGHHQRSNASLAVAAIEAVNAIGDWEISGNAILQGLLNSQLDGRTQVTSRCPTVVLDVAHNVASANVLIDTLGAELTDWSSAGQKSLVLAISKDKDCEGILQVLLPAFDRVWVTKYQDNPRGVAAEELYELAGKVARQQSLEVEIDVAPTPDLAWQAATDSLEPTDVLCCTGSVFLIAELIELAKK